MRTVLVKTLALLFASGAVHAGEILQDKWEGFFPIYFGEIGLHGQVFIAQDPHISFAFFYREWDPNEPNEPLELRLYDGNGTAGSMLGSALFTLPAGFAGFY
ncbi:MAG: hypothetical protein ACM3U2_23500, partial [Deltaproteobacteria bacterium]